MLAIGLVASLSLLFSGCASEPESQSEGTAGMNLDAAPPEQPKGIVEFEQVKPGEGEGIKVGFTQLTLSSVFPQALQKGMEEQAEIAGIELVTCDSQMDAGKALDCAKQFATQNVDALVTFQADVAASPEICDAGPDVPVFAVDIEQQPCQTSFVGAANTYAGEIVGYGLGKWFAENEKCEYDAFVSLESTAVGEVNDMRMGGIRSGFESVCGTIHDLKIIDTGSGGQADTALQQMTDTLTSLPGLEKIIVVGINEDVVVGALGAARTQDRIDDLYLGVQNFDPSNCTITEAPNWIGSAGYFPERYAELIIPNVIRAAKGEEVSADLLVPHEFITKDNVKEFYPEYSCS